MRSDLWDAIYHQIWEPEFQAIQTYILVILGVIFLLGIATLLGILICHIRKNR